jgi:hypothetical protein
MVTLRVPYPMGFYAKGLDGRIDDPNAGWKGRGLWSTVGSRTPFHMEGGKGTLPKVIHFQIRPNPLADSVEQHCWSSFLLPHVGEGGARLLHKLQLRLKT